MSAPASALRAEADGLVAGEMVRLAVTMDGLERLFGALQIEALADLTRRLRGMDPRAVRGAILCFAVDKAQGERVAAAMTPGDLFAGHALATRAMVLAFPPAEKPKRGKREAAAETG